MTARFYIQIASARGVAERWRRQYQHGAHWTDTVKGSSEDVYNKLCALGEVPDVAAVATAIGNKSWSHLTCAGCDDHVTRAIKIRGEYDDGVLLCRACVTEAAKAFSD
jgi:hypothetical protein